MVESNTTKSLATNRFFLIAATLLCSWLGMMVVHEGRHVAAALLTGGKVLRVVLPPVGFSRTDVMPNPSPLAVTWAGPILGVLLPMVLWAVANWLKLSIAYLLRFFAGFCLVANGAYIGVGSFDQIGDTYAMLLFGSKMWQLWLFGLLTFPAGLLLWHRLGPHFGLGPGSPAVRPTHARAMCGMLLLIAGIQLIFNRGWRE